jgi:uncharacterized membrane protein YfhO
MITIIKKIELYIKNIFEKKEKTAVSITLITILLLVFLPHTIGNGLTLPFLGDYIFQQIYFYFEGYDAFWNFFTTGEIKLWSYSAFLGVNFFSANTFYYLTSPFFLPLLLFPRMFLIQGIFLTYLLKLFTGGFLIYILLRKYYKNSLIISLMASIIYMLNGWGMFYMWFNHFADVLAIVPLLFIASEEYLRSRKGLLISISVLLLAMTNYYFLFSFLILVTIYFTVRFSQLYKFKNDFIIYAKGAVFFFAGLLMSSFVLIPAALVVINIPRVSESTILQDLLNTNNLGEIIKFLFVFPERTFGIKISSIQTFLYPLVSLFVPPLNNYDSLIFDNNFYDNAQSSMYLSSSFIIFLIPAVINQFKYKNYKNLLIIAATALTLFIPFTYYLLNAFSQIYGRWHLFVVIVIIIFVSNFLDEMLKKDKPLDNSILLSYFLVNVILFVLFGYSRLIFNIGYKNNYVGYFVILVIVYLISMLIIRFNNNKKYFAKLILFTVTFELALVGTAVINEVGYLNYDLLYTNSESTKSFERLINTVKKKDPSFYRMYVDYGVDKINFPLYLNYKGLSSYNSVFNFSLVNFNSNRRISLSDMNWQLNINDKRAFLETFLNVKYRIIKKDNTVVPFGYEKVNEDGDYVLYRNVNHIELGYAFDAIFNDDNYLENEFYFQNDPDYLSYARLDDADYRYLVDYFDFKKVNEQEFIFKEMDLNKEKIICPLATLENPCHLIVKMDFGQLVKTTFYSDKRVISEDITVLDWLSDDFKNARGLYLYEPADSVFFAKSADETTNKGSFETIKIYYVYYDEYLSVLSNLKANKFNNIKHTNNKISFETNYDSAKFIVLSVPFDDGWTLKVNGKTEKIYRSNDGFISFIAEKGNNNYKLDYFTPGLLSGIVLSLIGLILLILLTFIRKKKISISNQI